MTPGDLLRFPQAISIREHAEEAEGADEMIGRRASRSAVAEALDELDGMREREGGYLRADLDARRARLGELFERRPRGRRGREAGLRARLAGARREMRADALVDDAARRAGDCPVRRPVRHHARRSCGSAAHLEHWRALSDSPEPCGRKLDFLLQEMNREVNTVGSKAEGPGVSELVVALKAELEKMREQVQNVE